ncbi:creatininase family protein [Desulfospira joergensenii]|uniref:creatininase family protein n=1 Tax=Desulfospira joergensenii TaxID=53329 RepID=UPI0003B5EDC3|nr:creatininase family protein [Desulfospira joergensenii]
MSESSVWLQDMTWEEAGQIIEQSGKTILIPVGSTEQHGYHLPLGTDTMVAAAVAEDAAKKARVPVAPPLWFGWSPHHMVLPGTITVRPELLAELCFDIISSLSRHGFENFVLINGHRIVNITWLQIAAERAKRELGVHPVIFDPAYMSKSLTASMGWGSVGHAEEIETSQMMHCHPDLVKIDRAVDHPHRAVNLYSVDPSFEGDTLCYVPSSPDEMKALAESSGGTAGEPTKASEKGGKIYHNHLVTRLVEVIRDLQAKGN